MSKKRRTQTPCAALFLPFYLFTFSLRIVTTATGGKRCNGEPRRAVTIDHQTVAGSYAQTRERGTVGIVAGRADGFARAVHLGREGHVAQVRTTDGQRRDGSRCVRAATSNDSSTVAPLLYVKRTAPNP